MTDIQRLVSNAKIELYLSRHEIFERVRMRTIASAVGRTEQRTGKTSANQPCWGDAFHLASHNLYLNGQLRRLDYNRERLLARFTTALNKNDTLTNRPTKKSQKNGYGKRKKRRNVVAPENLKKRYYGKPYSYYAHFSDDEKNPLSYEHVQFGGYSV